MKEPKKPKKWGMNTSLVIGLCFGIAIGTSLDNIAFGIPIGLLFGYAMGCSNQSKE